MRLPSLAEIDAELARRDISDDVDACAGSLAEFVRRAWHVVEPDTEYQVGRHIDVMCTALEDLYRTWARARDLVSRVDSSVNRSLPAGDPAYGQPADTDALAELEEMQEDVRDLIINVPPGHAKSLITRVFFPAWVWTLSPGCRFVHASMNQDLATRDNVRMRDLVLSEWYQARWPVGMKSDVNLKTRFVNEHTGYSQAISVGSGTGTRWDIGLLDDPHEIADRNSVDLVRKTSDWVTSTWTSRRSDPRASVSVLIMQRVHERDATVALAEKAKRTPRHICLPAVYEPNHPHVCEEDWRTQEGELLWPSRYGEETIEAERAKGSIDFASLQQQRPAPLDGAVFKRQHLQRYSITREGDAEVLVLRPAGKEAVRVPMERVVRLAGVDLAASDKQTSDYTAIAVLGVCPGGQRVILDVQRARVQGPDQPRFIRDAQARWRMSKVGVESVAYQLTMVQTMRQHKPGEVPVPVVAVHTDRSKVARAITLSTSFETGELFLPDNAAWLSDLEGELMMFPFGEHDDQVDAVGHADALARGMASVVPTVVRKGGVKWRD